jgi:hypothetical protein
MFRYWKRQLLAHGRSCRLMRPETGTSKTADQVSGRCDADGGTNPGLKAVFHLGPEQGDKKEENKV